MATQAQLEAAFQQLAVKHRDIARQLAETNANYLALRKALEEAPKSITAEIDSIPGRRIFYNLNAVQAFTIAQAGLRGQAMNFLVSQDGPFVMTHYPVAAWFPSAPDTAATFGRWRPIYTWPLPDQVVDEDIIDISWELVDGGSQRNFQNLPTPPMLSRHDLAIPLPVPTLFAPNTVIQFFPTYNAITFDSAEDPPTEGLLNVQLPGYKIVNM